jgi:hypothetical protein
MLIGGGETPSLVPPLSEDTPSLVPEDWPSPVPPVGPSAVSPELVHSSVSPPGTATDPHCQTLEVFPDGPDAVQPARAAAASVATTINEVRFMTEPPER